MHSSEYKDRLKQERKRIGISQENLASVLGLSRQTIILYESGKTLPDIHTLHELAAMGVDVLYVVTGRRLPYLPASDFDWKLLNEVIEGIGQTAAELGVKIPFEKRPVLMRQLYEEFRKTNYINDAKIEKLIRRTV